MTPRTEAGRKLAFDLFDVERQIELIESEASELDVALLAQAMYDALSDGGIVRIDADRPKELADIAASVAAAYGRLS